MLLFEIFVVVTCRRHAEGAWKGLWRQRLPPTSPASFARSTLSAVWRKERCMWIHNVLAMRKPLDTTHPPRKPYIAGNATPYKSLPNTSCSNEFLVQNTSVALPLVF